MPRIIPGTSYSRHDDVDTLDLDTADRMREAHVRGSMHETRDSDSDARNTPRAETADLTWRRPMNLDAPPPRPGYRQRWVRAEMRSESDNLNWQSKLREGWAPRDPSTVNGADAYFQTSAGTHQGTGVIRVGGLVLCEINEKILSSKRRAIEGMSRRQEDSVAMDTDKASREGVRAGMSPIVREERVEVSTGRRPQTLAD